MEAYLIKHCSPTLASIKTANLFTYAFRNRYKFLECLRRINQTLNKKGVYVEPLRIRDGRALIWVYRKSQLEQRLQETEISQFLATYGYKTKELTDVIVRLRERVIASEDFPHEIGILLGYPLPDIVAFIKNGGKNSKCTGCWKVYTDECEAMRLFDMYEKCTSIYVKLFAKGKSVPQLTVAA